MMMMRMRSMMRKIFMMMIATMMFVKFLVYKKRIRNCPSFSSHQDILIVVRMVVHMTVRMIARSRSARKQDRSLTSALCIHGRTQDIRHIG